MIPKFTLTILLTHATISEQNFDRKEWFKSLIASYKTTEISLNSPTLREGKAQKKKDFNPLVALFLLPLATDPKYWSIAVQKRTSRYRTNFAIAEESAHWHRKILAKQAGVKVWLII